MTIGETNIVQAEYFIDADPGFGKAISIPVLSPGDELTLTLLPDLQTLSQGIHYLQFRAMDAGGKWGTGANAIFVIIILPSPAESDIQQVEYFIDTDPGFGMGTPVTLPIAGSDLTIDFTVALDGLDDGNHVLYIRARNELNKWGHIYAEGFTYSATGTGQEGINSMFKIYPNPTGGIVQVELTGVALNDFRIRLMDMNGKLVYETECHDNRCELHLELPGGMYLFQIEGTGHSISQKIIIE
jgi:hypothetical protein